ncbi:MAG: Ig-like domain repeat protein, partial [Bryobacteraceae bacterium]
MKHQEGIRVPAGRIGKSAQEIALPAMLLLLSVPALAQAPTAQPPYFTPGNLVVSVAGCGVYGGTPPNATPSTATCATPPVGGTGATTGTGPNSYGDDQAAPWSLWQYSVNGASSVAFVNSLQLPQNTSGANFPISDDYGSQSEGTLQLSGNGLYLTLIGYGINGATFNVNYLDYCPGSTMLSNACVPENGNPAAAQTGTLLGQTYSGNTPVPRVVALIDPNGNVNTSTVLYGIFNQNDARSAYSPDGVNIYVSGQGCKNWDPSDELCDSASKNYDDTQGVYLTTLGTNNGNGLNNPIAITGPDNGPSGCTNTTTCTSSESTRMVQIYNGTLYVSADDKPGGAGYNRALIGTLGDPPATSLFTCTGVGGGCGTGYGPYGPALMPGFGNTGGTGKYTINSQGSGNTSNGNSLNNTGLAINLSPQNFFFASPTVLYVADTGSPKNSSNTDTTCTGLGGTGSVGDGGLQKWILNPTVTASVTNSGSTSAKETVTATSGAFTQGEVGLTITDSLGYIPAGTTITAVSGAGANATMSAPATGTSSSDVITVHGWSLAYTLYNGLNLVLATNCNPNALAAPQDLATTGLYGVTGTVSGGVATLYVTTYPNNDLVQTYLYGITDTLATEKMTSPGTAFTLLDTAPAGSILRGVTFVPKFQNGDVAVTTVPSGLTVTSAGSGCAPSTFTTPLTLAWTPTSACQLSVTTPQTSAYTPGTQYVFSQWQDGSTGTTYSVAAPSSTATNTYTYTASFTTQYQLTTAATTGGTVSAGGYYNSGANAIITATPSAGSYFVNFTVVDSNGNTTTPTSNPLTLTMNGPESVTANFSAQTTQAITFTQNAPASAAYNSQFTVAATGGASGNAVTFSSSGSCSNSGATYTITSGTGTCSVIANQAGNTDYSAAPTATETTNATPASQTITFTPPASPAAYNSSFAVSATSTSGLTVTIGASGVCSISSGTVTMTSGTGTCTLTASQSGNGNYSAAANVVNTVTAATASQSITFTPPSSPAAYNSSFAVSATSTSGLTVTIGASGVCSISGGTVTMTSGTGTCTLTASQSGNGNYSAAANVVNTVTATMLSGSGNISVTAGSVASSIYPNQADTLSATVTVTGAGGAPAGTGETVSFYDGATLLGTGTLSTVDAYHSSTSISITGSQLSLGGNSITAVYSGDANYSSTTSAAITVTLASPLVNFGPSSVGTAATGQTLSYTFTSATTLTAVNILTSGAPGLDYTDGGSSTCTATAYTAGQSCVVSAAFTPTAPGARAGAVTLFAQGSNLPLMTWYLSGVGNSGAVTIDPGTLTTTTLTGTSTPAGYGTAVDGAGNVYVVDHANNAVLKLAAGTFLQSTVVSGLTDATGVALDGAGDLYISTGSSVVMIPNENGTLNAADQSTVNLTGLASARGVAVDSSGDLYVADATNGNVVEWSSLGVQTTIVSGLTSPHGVAVDAALNVYVATNNAVTQYPYPSYGGGTAVPYGTGYNNPRGIAVDAAGAVYVADTGNNRIVRVSPGGGSQATLTVTGVSSPQGVSVDAWDNLYVTDPSIVIQVNRTQAAQLSFAATNVDSTSAAQVVTVTDAGNQALQVSNLAISAPFASAASGGTDCTSSTDLSAGGQCEIGVAFAPTASGPATGTVSLSDNALNNTGSTQTVSLSGAGSQVAQTITFPAPASPAAYNTSFAVSATSTSGLTVTIGASGTCSISSGTVTMTSGTGTCTLTASQSGNTEYSAAANVVNTVTAATASQSITFPAPASPAAYNSSFQVSATSTSGLTVTIGASGVCSISGGTVTMTSGTGTCTLTVSQSGNGNYSAAANVLRTVAATLASQTITFPAPASPAPYNASFAVSATSTSGLTATIGASGVCSILSGTVKITSGSGTC